MMKLTEYLNIQKDLNDHCPRYPVDTELQWAIVAELGEFANSRKGEWCWWQRKDKVIESQPLNEQLAEIADIMCFLLTGMLIEKRETTDEKIDQMLEFFIGWRNRMSPLMMLNRILQHLAKWEYSHSFCYLLQFCIQLGYNIEDIERAYLLKVQINKDRWSTLPG